ncbi:hypothetical protein DCCM_3243 [Desulfocucumis palustris]|uniref:Uncharacterized protein n=1 Tax=Desulfocucumis palustris TaxID=1898651 RepID=A0A2L2XJN0_9FIRM|nr:hypothetical protein DCCM_3243 [Desulfocucumis palustris]
MAQIVYYLLIGMPFDQHIIDSFHDFRRQCCHLVVLTA